MERVTLGVVGDPFVGKTLLCVSYTANYVYKDYKPTVLNHHWTNVVVKDHVVDLTIWDTSGSDEYRKLRPLCYPQVDAFLVCFSLKCPESFTHVQSKWIPEIEEQFSKIPVVLVGCKRDDCLKSSQESLDTIDTEEGEEMARAIRATKYVETSAVEQSGFTSVFHTAILAGLERKKSLTW
ncbi:cdc42 homolog [Mercenaria mercenaria]|uniref:cdc42 homolog n=1 Tax=Mercenaria mercenaria TaxID=6596 RepID=UPI00234F97BE|nr:cdc42 homolog [Mercenaria mercenaria]